MMSGAVLAESRFSLDAFEAFLSGRQEPGWLVDQRRAAWEAFASLDLPDRKQEEWMRTDLRALPLDRFGPPEPAAEPPSLPTALLAEGVELAGRDATVNSRPAGTQVPYDLASRGVLFGSLDRLACQHADRLRGYLEHRLVDVRADKFAALAGAFWSGGTLLYVPRGVTIEQPLHMLTALTPGGVDLGRVVVVLEEDAEATVLAETASTDPAATGLHCGAIELFVGPRARLRYVNLQNWGTGVWHFAHQQASVAAGGSLQWTIGALGARLAQVNQHVSLAGEGAEAQVNGAMFTEGRQHLAYHTRQDHHAAYCRSDLLYKGALQDKSRIVWRGMIHVDPGSLKTDAYQRNDNLVLSETARSDSIPGLEILADDVRCTHGSTIGRVDDELIFYAMSRGLTRKEAVRMVVTGFFQQVFDRITIPSVRQALGEAIGRRVREYA
jgi:Fe-S cluster assembly protein SufD